MRSKRKPGHWKFTLSRHNFFVLPAICLEWERSRFDIYYSVHLVWLNAGASYMKHIITNQEEYDNNVDSIRGATASAMPQEVQLKDLEPGAEVYLLKVTGLNMWVKGYDIALHKYVTTEDRSYARAYVKEEAEGVQFFLQYQDPKIFTILELADPEQALPI